jgi:aminobenzoyl-glutamate utilization protein B
MLHASNAMAMTMLDLFENQKLIDKIKTEYVERKGNEVYKAIIPDGPPPIPKNK